MILDIREFRSDENLYKALQKIGNRDTRLEKGEVDQNRDGYLDCQPLFLASLSAGEFSRLEERLLQKGLIIHRRSAEEVSLLLDDLKRKLPPHLTEKEKMAFASRLPAIIEAARKSRSALKRSVDLVGSTLAVYRPQNLNEIRAWSEAVVFLIEHSKGYVKFMNQSVAELQLDWRRCHPRDFAEEFAGKLNRYVRERARPLKGPLLRAAKIINKVHDREIDRDPSDRMRKEISARLEPRTAYLMMAVGGRNLYTTSFLTIWSSQKIGKIRDWLRQVDPEERYVPGFLRRISKFGLSSILKGEEDYFFRIGMEVLQRTDEPVADTAILTDLFERLLPSASAESKRSLAEQLLTLYRSSEIDPRRRWCIGFLIKHFGEAYQLGDLYTSFREVMRRLPVIERPLVPRKEWLADGALTAKLFFYDDSSWFDATIRTYQTKWGWKVASRTDSETVLEKMVQGIPLRLILVHRSEEEETAEESFDGIDIAVHRGHSYTVHRTFSEKGPHISGRLLMDGSCGSLGNLVEEAFADRFFGNYLLGDINQGRGEVNTEFLERFMTSVARGETSWEAFDSYRGFGLIFPHHAALLVYPYVRSHRTDSKIY